MLGPPWVTAVIMAAVTTAIIDYWERELGKLKCTEPSGGYSQIISERIQKHLVSYGGADPHHEMDVVLRIPHVSYHRGGQGSARGVGTREPTQPWATVP